MPKHCSTTAFGFDKPPVATGTDFSISSDGRRLRQRRVQYTEADLSSHPSSEADNESDGSDDNDSQDSFQDPYHKINFEDDKQDIEGLSYSGGINDAVTMDEGLQGLSEAQDPSSASVNVTRPFNLHSDNPSRAWIPYREEYLRDMLFLEGRRGMGSACSECRAANPAFRCTDDDCLSAGMMCKECLLSTHKRLPLHWVEEWIGAYFRTTSLQTLGLIIQLGHSSLEGGCIFSHKARDITLVHTNGIHGVTDRYRVFLRCMFQWRHLKMCKRGARGHTAGGIAGTQLGELAIDCPACPHPGKNLPADYINSPPELAFLYYMFLAIDANFRLRNRMTSNHYKSPTLGDGWAYLVPRAAYEEHILRYVNQEEMSSCSGFAAMFLANLKNVKGLRVSGVGGICCGRHRVWRANGLGDLQRGERYCNMDFIFWSTIHGEEYLCIVVSYDIACQWSRNFWSRMDDIDPSIRVKYGEGQIMFLVPKFHLRAHQASCQADYSFNYAPGVGHTHGEVVEEGWAQSNKAAGQTKEMGPGTRAMTLDDIFGFANWRTIENLDNVLGKRLLNAIKSFDEHYVDFNNFHAGLIVNVGETVLAEWDDMVKAWDNDHTELCPYTMEEDGDEGTHFKDMELKLARQEHSRLASGLPGHPSSLCVFVVEGIMLGEVQRGIELFITVNKYMTPTQDLELQRRRTNLLKRITHFRNLQRLLMPRLADVISEEDMERIENSDNEKPEQIKLFLPSECGTLREAEALDALQGVRDGLRARTGSSRFKMQNVTGQVGNTRASGILRQIDIRIHARKIRYRLARDALLRLRGHGDWEQSIRELKDADVRGLSERVLTREEADRREHLRERAIREKDLDNNDFYFQEEGIQSRVQGETRRALSWIWWDQWELKEGTTDDPDYIDGEFTHPVCTYRNRRYGHTSTGIFLSDEFLAAVRVEYCKSKARLDRSKEEVQLLCEELRRMMEYSLWKAEWWLSRRLGGEGMLSIGESVTAELADGLNSYALQQVSIMKNRHDHLDKTWTPLIEHAKKVLNRAPDISTLSFELKDKERSDADAQRAETEV
ncbi:hypothetical protein K435DRAFT_866769 [Dendrothele bispora CBS 962.96]|uniref:CxC2-like cysteine cluster KDZ transposase-associated domain-containing protein n=1 Tax=Dendrothele bispora (strain CBS 962.96) TaxID=1314807 RepID=A0A4S8LGI9_DENBC|nr:hypothetical protein K435DRAFT_866769 [Dendrothele bispora CBS 962.96]